MSIGESSQMGAENLCRRAHQTAGIIVSAVVSMSVVLPLNAQTTSIGSGRPAVEVNEQAIYFGTPQYVGGALSAGPAVGVLPPLYDPRTGVLRSRVVNLVPPPQIALQLIPPAAGRDGIPAPPEIARSRVIDLPARDSSDFAELAPPPPPTARPSLPRRQEVAATPRTEIRQPDLPRIDPPVPTPPSVSLPEPGDSVADAPPMIDLPPPVIETETTDPDPATTAMTETTPSIPPPPAPPAASTGTSTLPPPPAVDMPAAPDIAATMAPDESSPDTMPAAPSAPETAAAMPDIPPPPSTAATIPPPPAVESPSTTEMPSASEIATTDAPAEEMVVAERESTAAMPPPAPTLPAVQTLAGGATMIPFAPGDAELPSDAAPDLAAVAEQVKAGDGTRIQLKAYAAGESNRPSAARRLSLSRALAVRSFLIEAGVRSTNIDVRALGSKVESGPADRVDVVVLN